MASKTKKQRKEVAAKETGQHINEIASVQIQLDVLRKQGILVDVEVSGSSLFTRQTSWAELGIFDEDDLRKERFTRGQKYLISPEQIKKWKSCESKLRQNLKRYAQDVSGFAPWRWIGYKAYPHWKKTHNDIVIQAMKIKEEILENYDGYFDNLKNDWAHIANNIWTKTTKGIKKDAVPLIFVGKDVVDNREDFVDLIVARASQKMPSRERVEKELGMNYQTAIVFGGADVKADMVESGKLAKIYELEQIELEKAERMAYLEKQEKLQDVQHDAEMKRLEREEAVIKIEAMREAELENARERLQTMVSPFEQVFTSLRERFAEDVEKMLISIKKNGSVRGKIAEQGRGLISLFDMLAVHDDSELREKLDSLKTEIGDVGKSRTADAPDRDIPKIEDLLNEIGDLADKAADDLAKKPNRFTYLE